MITHVAIIKEGKLWALPKPYRHHHILAMIWESEKTNGIILQAKGVQGFLNDSGKFLTREEAKQEAIIHKQIREGCGKFPQLYSEDVW